MSNATDVFIKINDDEVNSERVEEMYISADGKRYLDVMNMDDVDEIIAQMRENLKGVFTKNKSEIDFTDYVSLDFDKIRKEDPDIDEELPL